MAPRVFNQVSEIEVERTSIEDIQQLINEVMYKIINEAEFDTKKALDILYKECHPCVTKLFSSSADFFLKMAAIVDYILQIVPKLMSFMLRYVVELDGVYVFVGTNKSSSNQLEAWLFLAEENENKVSLEQKLQSMMAELEAQRWSCYLYSIESGNMKAFHSKN
ncbi:MAG: hypothetical protein LRY73_14225 [Bacillus sp. (in: Bacteria)]|nr:hypothetical protein [Bacillus sp. (in: firmicutes)]